MISPAELFPILSILITIIMLVGGVVYFRGSIAKTSSEVQERVINALNSEIDALNSRIAEKDRVAEGKIATLNERIGELEKDNTRLKQTLGTIKSALRKARLTVDLDGNLVSIADPPMHASSHIGTAHTTEEI